VKRKSVVFYNPRGESHILPLALVHLASLFRVRDVHIVDGRVEVAPEARIVELTRDALCLGVSVLTGAPIVDALAVTKAAKRARPDLPVIWGGWHPSLLPEQCLASGAVDLCVSGQGERTMVEIVQAMEEGDASPRGIMGTAWWHNDQMVQGLPRPFEDVNRFLDRMDKLIRDVRALPRMPGVDRIYLPGELEWLAKEQRTRTGIPLPRALFEELMGLAEKYQVDQVLQPLTTPHVP